MSYQPPFNGGRINASIGGNTAGAAALVSSGTLTLAGGNNITLSQAGSAITISGNAGGIALANSQTTYTSGTANLVASGALTIASTAGQSYNFSVPSVSSLSATGAVSISNNAGTISIGAPIQSNQTLGMYASGANTIGQSSSSTLDARSFNISGQGALSAGMSGNTLQLSVAAQTAYQFSNSNGISFGTNGSTVTATVATNYAASTHTHGSPSLQLTNVSGTTASASNGLTLSLSVAPMFDAGMTSGGNSSGTSGVNTNGMAFYAGNNITLSQATNANGATMSIIGPNAGGGVAISAPGSSYSSGTINFSAAGGALTISGSTNSVISMSVPATSSIVGSNGIYVSVAGNNIILDGSALSGGYDPPPALQRWEYPQNAFTSIGTPAIGSLSIQHQYIPFNVTATAAKIAVSLTVSTFTTAGSTATANYSLSMGMYTMNGANLSLINSATGYALNSFSWGNTANAQYTQTVTGLRQFTVPLNANITPGEYWMAALISSATSTAGASATMMGASMIHNTGVLGVIGSSTSAGRDVYLGQGIYSTTTGAFPTVIPFAAINNTGAGNAMRANFYNVIYNSTY